MATYAIDSKQQGLRATGIVEPVFAWIEDPATGRRKQSGDQDRNDQGIPLWSVEVTYIAESYGRSSTAVSKVTVATTQQPVVAAFDLVEFEGLTVSVSVNKSAGVLREFWTAAGMGGTKTKAAA